ncbi:MAG TPA: hypothetical protein DEF61_00535, partial [Firmicutes bacterium]|nr:hypothetical protein [Bacillota bacterium]
SDPNRFRMIFDEIMAKNDQFFVLADFPSYLEACSRAEKMYLDRKNWARSALINIASSGYFTSDRTIEEYNKDIWHLEKLK